jgi:hypothetical protein
MGVAGLVAGLIFPILGVDNARARIEWEAGHMMFLRLEGVLFILGGYVIYKIAKPREAESAVAPSNTSLERTRAR